MNTYDVEILADSVVPSGHRLTTVEMTFPRFILAELNTHRMLSRNSASSRAIPTEKQIDRVMNFPFIPEFNKRVAGMGVGEALGRREQSQAQQRWLEAREAAVQAAQALIHVDKSRANRLLEPFMWHTAIVSATEWENFFNLRCHPAAQPEFRRIAEMVRAEMAASTPKELRPGKDWHLPLVYIEDETCCRPDVRDDLYMAKVSAGRCARVSYDRMHDTEPPTESARRWETLSKAGHWSPGEHPALAWWGDEHDKTDLGNFQGFKQLRKFHAGEAVFSG